MIQDISIQNGDMVTLAKVVNHNTRSLDEKFNNFSAGVSNAFGAVEKDMHTVAKKLQLNKKSILRLSMSIIFVDVALILTDRRIKRLEKRIQELEDQKIVDDFMGDDDK